MGIEVSEERLEAALKAAEKNGPLGSQDELWIEVARRYNSGDGLPKRFSARPREAITKSICYQKISRKLKLTVKTPKKKSGRPTGTSPMRAILDYLTMEAVEQKWLKDNENGWNSINSARFALGLKTVEPIDKPTKEYFNENS